VAFTFLVAAALVAVGVLAFLLFQLLQKVEGIRSQEQTLSLFQQQIESLRLQVSQSLSESQKLVEQKLSAINTDLNARLADMNRQVLESSQNLSGVVGAVQRSLGELGQQSQRILEVGKNIATLQEILKPPKLRGGLGETFLGELLSQILPPAHFELQHRFASGEAVDAVIRVGERLVPVDSKFPLENFKRTLEAQAEEERRAARRAFGTDVKKHVDSIATKYILPDEGTYDFALMYIPAENVYYETIIRDEAFGEEKSLAAYAYKRRVVPVSPNSLYAYLQVILLGLKGLKIEEQAQRILAELQRLGGEFGRFAEAFEKVGTHLGNAQKAYAETEKRLTKLEARIDGLGKAETAAVEGEPAAALPRGGGAQPLGLGPLPG